MHPQRVRDTSHSNIWEAMEMRWSEGKDGERHGDGKERGSGESVKVASVSPGRSRKDKRVAAATLRRPLNSALLVFMVGFVCQRRRES